MESKKLVHRSRIAIRWGDMDALGHVNNTVYFRYMEQARIDWMAKMGNVIGPVHGPVMVNAQCNFLRQLKFPGEVEVFCYTGAVGRSSFETAYEICRVDVPEVIFAEGSAKMVWIDFKQEKSIPLPDAIRQMLVD